MEEVKENVSENSKSNEDIILELQSQLKELIKENNSLKIENNNISIDKTKIEGELELFKLSNSVLEKENIKFKENLVDNTGVADIEIEKELSYDDYMKG